MKLLVAVKRVPDPYGRVRLTEDGAHLDTSEARPVVNPYDEIALDIAHALRQSGVASEAVAASVASSRAAAQGHEETLRAALARGADRALLLTVEDAPDSQTVALAVADAARRDEVSLVLCGRQGADSDDGQTGARVAGLLGWPLLAAAGSVEVVGGGGRVRVTRASDAGAETVEAALPAVVTCDLRGRDPRPVPLPLILKAKGKPLESTHPLPPPSQAKEGKSALCTTGYALPPTRGACRMVGSVDELLAALKEREGGNATGEAAPAVPESDDVIVGTEAEADALAWVAGRRGWPLVRNVVSVETAGDGGLRVTHAVHAGRFRRAVEVSAAAASPVVLIVPAAMQTAAQRARVAALLADERPLLGERVALERPGGARPDLATARVIVAGGRPLRDAETFERLAGGLADALGGAAAASGGAVNAGITPSWMLIGQTGRTVAPDLYVALGISGSDQHVAGMQGAKTIVAVNTDAEAPIFHVADLGLAADLHSVVPEWIAKTK